MHALIVVDLQNDFLPGGALAVPDGDAVVPVANRLLRALAGRPGWWIVATQDWHPADHRSFASQHPGRAVGEVIDLEGLPQVLWPDHCVQGTSGASFASALEVWHLDAGVRKGTDRDIDSYSGFHDNGHRRDTGLAAALRKRGVEDVVLLGLATDYCVKFTALDARAEGFRTSVLTDGVRAVDLEAGDGARALEELRQHGVTLETSDALLQRVATDPSTPNHP